MYKQITYPETFTFDWFNNVYKSLLDGELSVDDYKKTFDYLVEKKQQAIDLLSKKTKDELLSMVGGMTAYRLKTEKKDKVVEGVYKSMFDGLNISSFTYSMGENYMDALERNFKKQTQESLDDFAKDVAKNREERRVQLEKIKKALENPESLEEFKVFIKKNGVSSLSQEKRKLYDSLVGESVLEKRKEEVEAKSEIKKVEGLKTGMSLSETVHTKEKYPLFVVQLTDRVEKDVYTELNTKAKKLGGWYSSFRGSGAIPGFQFKDKEQALKFMELKEGDVSNIEKIEERIEAKAEKRADKLRETANSVIQKADETINADRLTNTARRASMASGVEDRARAEKALAKTMLNIADAIDSGEAKYLDNISAKTHVELLDILVRRAKNKELNAKYPSYAERQKHEGEPATEETIDLVEDIYYPSIYVGHIKDLINKSESRSGGKLLARRWEKKIVKYTQNENYQIKSDEEMEELKKMYDSLHISDKKYNRIKDYLTDFYRMKAMKIENSSMLREVLREYVKYRGGVEQKDKVKELERGLAGRKDVGIDYFPTPKSVAERMVEMAEIKEGMSILEPSAGNGNIADVIKQSTGISPDVIEISSTLRDILLAKGYNVVANDFIDFSDKKYDRIIMNPPFSNGMDADHIKHAYELLNPGGRVVAIAGEGIFFRSDKKAKDFQEFLSLHDVESEKLDANTFMDKSLYSTTGANARLIVINKQMDSNKNWNEAYGSIVEIIEDLGEMDTSDAQGLIDANEEKAKQLLSSGKSFSEIANEVLGGDQLSKGTEHEKEHQKTLEKVASGEISVEDAVKETAKTHLEEDPNYYTHLQKMEEENKLSEVELDLEYNKFILEVEKLVKQDNKRLAVSNLDLMGNFVSENPEYFKKYIDFVYSLPAKFRVTINPYDADYGSKRIVDYLEQKGINFLDLLPVKTYKLPKYKPFETSTDDKVFMGIHSDFVGNDEIRPVMMGTYFDENGVTSTDAHKLLFTPYRGSKPSEQGIYCFTSKCFKASDGEEKMPGKYPNYAQVIPTKMPIKMAINEGALYNFLKNSIDLKIVNPVTKAVVLTFSDENAEGGKYSIGFNAEFLADGIEAMAALGHKDVEMSFSQPNKAALIYPRGQYGAIVENKYLQTDFVLIMPVMISDDAKHKVTERFDLDTNCMTFIDSSVKYCFDLDEMEKESLRKKSQQMEEELSESKSKIAQLEEIERLKKLEKDAKKEARRKALQEEIDRLEQERLRIEQERIEAEQKQREMEEQAAGDINALRDSLVAAQSTVEFLDGEQKSEMEDYISGLEVLIESMSYENGGALKSYYDVVYSTKSGKQYVAKNILAESELEADKTLRKQMQASSTFKGVVMVTPKYDLGGGVDAKSMTKEQYEQKLRDYDRVGELLDDEENSIRKEELRKELKILGSEIHKYERQYAKGGELKNKSVNSRIKTNKKMAAQKQTKAGKKADKAKKALHPGKRTSASGNTYVENRPNRSDKNRTKKI